ncbi:MAG: hypothetical protein ACE5OZ_23105 [Candidatus Heimdallarchaeota archaeon]
MTTYYVEVVNLSQDDKQQKGINPYSIKLTALERERYEKLAETYGFSTLSSLIRRAMAVVEATPKLLKEFDPSGGATYETALKFYSRMEEERSNRRVREEAERRWKERVDEKLDFLLNKVVKTKEDKQAIKKLQNSTGALEAIFK